ncbi:uncharacterized protein LOC119362999 isoform X2 [Triticum dicoccoides]|uniref:uncharacterized protein LOC119362999 isoform X2 n=1 Tax=Triticum dicoccoides TaxID=85692 RepID=UPI000E7971F4|nr:uncharacterized protein LOC119362999 isoform X2 [Triticum dicoccoides]
MESDLLIRQEEVGAERGDDFRSRCWEIFNWDVFDPDELLPRRQAVKAPIMKIGMSSIYLTACWRAPDSDACYICGQDGHYEQSCHYNYIYGRYGLYDQHTCRANCLPGPHTMAMACRNSLQSFIRVNNMPSRFCTWDLRKLLEPFGPLLMCHVPMGSSEVRRGYGVVIFKDRGDGERAIEALNGYLVGKSKLRVDWAYAMAPGGRPREKCNISKTKRVFKSRPPLQGPGKQRALGFLLPKFWRFYPSCNTLLLRKSNNTVPINGAGEERQKMNVESSGAIKTSWRDPDAKSCWICGDEERGHSEPTCPYNYLSPASYAPCRTRLLLWQHETSRACPRPKDLDATSLRRLKFLRCFVRVNNLPRHCCPEKLVGLFVRFGPLQSWHVAFADHGSGACSGFGYMVFRHRAHAEEAIDVLNCCVFSERKLRVDWAYPCA